ncbi:hypothetical protein [Sphingomonas sp. SRS2]|uniref:hypothetical protein n=1 Tax=Sphingomonas sp. SRS2 TaxID=133190 RepID=UPI0006184CC4|nr:hypothetical protein [Sphingomonas sp. SRS2]KKC25173.1 hypothetical protein WP12_15510 [Sphingomonas sp. SRS2]
MIRCSGRSRRTSRRNGSHPDQAGGDVKLARFRAAPNPNPFIDPGSCRAYADKFEPLLEARLAKERREAAK